MTLREIKPVTEAEFTRQVLALARLHGWRAIHIRPARTATGWRTAIQGDGVGFPDIFAVRGSRVIALELKTRRGRLTPQQVLWLDALRAAGVEAGVFRPDDWAMVEKLLAR